MKCSTCRKSTTAARWRERPRLSDAESKGSWNADVKAYWSFCAAAKRLEGQDNFNAYMHSVHMIQQLYVRFAVK